MKNTIASELSNFVTDTKFADLPEKVIYFTKYFILDHLGCVLGEAS